jgi:hypothetical protein
MSALREISTMPKAARLGQSERQALSQPDRYALTAKTAIVVPRLIHPRPVVLVSMLIKPVRIFKSVEFPAVADLPISNRYKARNFIQKHHPLISALISLPCAVLSRRIFACAVGNKLRYWVNNTKYHLANVKLSRSLAINL